MQISTKIRTEINEFKDIIEPPHLKGRGKMDLHHINKKRNENNLLNVVPLNHFEHINLVHCVNKNNLEKIELEAKIKERQIEVYEYLEGYPTDEFLELIKQERYSNVINYKKYLDRFLIDYNA